MNDWFQAGYFFGDLLVRREDYPSFIPLSKALMKHAGNPFLIQESRPPTKVSSGYNEWGQQPGLSTGSDTTNINQSIAAVVFVWPTFSSYFSIDKTNNFKS